VYFPALFDNGFIFLIQRLVIQVASLLSNRRFFFTFFVLTQKKITKKSQVSSEYGPLLTGSFVGRWCMVVSALIILPLGLLQSKYSLHPDSLIGKLVFLREIF
jgi:hypothetical protein